MELHDEGKGVPFPGLEIGEMEASQAEVRAEGKPSAVVQEDNEDSQGVDKDKQHIQVLEVEHLCIINRNEHMHERMPNEEVVIQERDM